MALAFDMSRNEYTSVDEWMLRKIHDEGEDTVLRCHWFTTVNYEGHVMRVCLRDSRDLVSNVVRGLGRWRDCDAVEQYAEANDIQTFLNIGANIGTCAVAMATNRPNVEMLLVEPDKTNLMFLIENMDQFPRATVYPFALGSVQGVGKMWTPVGNSGGNQFSSSGTEEVDVFRFDDVVDDLGDFDMVLIDVEGFECEVVCGAFETIRRGGWQHVQMEVEESALERNGCSAALLVDILDGLGFYKVGESSAFPTLSNFVHIIHDWHFEWSPPGDFLLMNSRMHCETISARQGFVHPSEVSMDT